MCRGRGRVREAREKGESGGFLVKKDEVNAVSSTVLVVEGIVAHIDSERGREDGVAFFKVGGMRGVRGCRPTLGG